MKLSSDAFEHGGQIPAKYGCQGEDISLPLTFEEVPEQTASLALLMEGSDGFVHWILYNIPYNIEALPEAIPPAAMLNQTIIHGFNDSNRLGYKGPCPSDHSSKYRITLYALDIKLDEAPPGYNKAELLKAIEGHIVAEAILVGNYLS